MKAIIYSDKQIEIANLKLKQWQDNIDFIEERIREQNKHGFSRIGMSGASMRTYSHLDIEEFQRKIDFVSANLESTYEARLIESAKQTHIQSKYENGLANI